ncbi:MAG TPA: hypothetical protein VNL36_06865, partial [Bacteroidota bacterium]|nr:hypothetical protein [Bacteroidota bacterium]
LSYGASSPVGEKYRSQYTKARLAFQRISARSSYRALWRLSQYRDTLSYRPKRLSRYRIHRLLQGCRL